jgi:flagellar L-ring protein precursor FlgH
MMRHTALLLGAVLLLGGCSDFLTRLSEVGGPPKMTRTADLTKDPNYPNARVPMPVPEMVAVQANSLWRPGGRQFFKDQRAHAVGDVLTILINVNDVANEMNNTSITRNGNEGMQVPAMFGLQNVIPHALPHVSSSNLVNTGSSNSNITLGQIQRNEQVTTSLAGVITQVLPNANMVVVARQQMRVNGEMRELVVTGIVRPEDIASDNTVLHDRLAEARIVYGGRGTMSDQQVPRYGQQLLDALMQF